MTDFWVTKDVKSTRKLHVCEWCRQPIPVGSLASKSAGVFEGEFQSRMAHVDCEDAVIEYHHMCGYSYDEFTTLSEIVGERENWDWLLEEYPNVAARVGIERK